MQQHLYESDHDDFRDLCRQFLAREAVPQYLTELTTDAQRQRWLPGFCSGDLVTAIAMSEPGAGSDLAGIRTEIMKEIIGRGLGL
ncbi:hypothetical protein [Micromonospora zingiberis]|uniref:hypothetical protein n=1 Tax=Micromonospora zingiberis TaxID=2053011 RepID=UPI001F0D1D73|nr:hypothetical protein [Micromonospora zingiberis]